MDSMDLKKAITPIEVALRYIGKPIKYTNNSIWYKSPFREEKTASFKVSDDKGFHDFGIGWHGDIFEFTEKYFNISFHHAKQMLMKDFGIMNCGYETTEVIKKKQQQREAEKRKKETITKWFNDTFNNLCKSYRKWQIIANTFKGRIDLNIYAKALNELTYIDYLLELFIDYSYDKSFLYDKREAIQCHLI